MAPAGKTQAPLAISMGEPAGIGTEILFRAWHHFADHPPGHGPAFFLIDDPVRVERLSRALGAKVPVTTIASPAEAADRFAQALPVLPLQGQERLAGLDTVTPGSPSPATAGAVTGSIQSAVHAIGAGEAAGLVTLPIQKETLVEAGFAHPGHTEYLEALTAEMEMPKGLMRGAVMILTAGPFRVVPVTVHVPLREVPGLLTVDRLIQVGIITAQAMRRGYGIDKPRLAVAGLNPHAGEGGKIGTEEQDVILPALLKMREMGLDVVGPVPADTMFHEEARAQYHAALAMYHDQALIPIKTVAFHAAVNTTLGLPIVRTSPDHGTGLDIAGKGVARPDSLINAIYTAARIAAARDSFDQRQDG